MKVNESSTKNVTTFKEVATISYPHDIVGSFAMSQSAGHYFTCLNGRTTFEVSELMYTNTYEDDSIKFRLTYGRTATDQPTARFCTTKTSNRLYNSASLPQKVEQCLDSILRPDIIPVPASISLISTQWSPLFRHPHCARPNVFLATLTNRGACCVYGRVFGREWTPTKNQKSKVSDLWADLCVRQANDSDMSDFRNFHAVVQTAHITAIGWRHDAENIARQINDQCLMFATSDGTIGVVHMNDEKSIQFNTRINRKKVNVIKWFSADATGAMSILIVADLDGNIGAYDVISAEDEGRVIRIENERQLWHESDRIKVGDIQVEFDNETNNLVVLVCKSTNVLLFLMKNGKCNRPIIHSVDAFFISGICRIGVLEYIICTLDGYIEKLSVCLSAKKTIKAEEIQSNINVNKFTIYGVATSKCNSYLLFALYPKKPFDHLVLRQPLTISVCTTNSSDLLEKLQNNSKSNRLTDLYGAVEMLRLMELKAVSITDEHLAFPTSDDVFSDESFLYALRLQLTLRTIRSGYLYRKSRNRDLIELSTESDFIAQTILSICYYRRLKHIFENESFTNLEPIQKQSAVCMRTFLLHYIADDPIVDKFKDSVQHIFSRIKAICSCMNFLEQVITTDLCKYCEAPIDADNQFMCSEKHDVNRCCITMLQLDLISHRSCPQCSGVALDSVETLKTITFSTDSIFMCPLCDVPMELINFDSE